MNIIARCGDTVTLDDFYCGMGGESTGAKAAGLEVRNCFNHWDLAIEVHRMNHPEAEHICADIGTYDVYGYNPSVAAWFSPECRMHSLASGISQKALRQPGLPGFDMFSKYDLTEEQERSRVSAGDILRHVQVHRYEWFIVENVVQFRDWEMFDSWIQEIINFGYDWKIVYLNSMFCHPTPQSRDRMYVCCWRKGNRAPDLDIRPAAFCENCGRDVNAVQSWKPTRTVAWGRYNEQYVYTCPDCYQRVEPYYYAAANVIDWTNIGTRIGDRKRPLSPNTMKRIEKGLQRFAAGIVETAYTKSERRARALYEPLPAQTTQQSQGVFMLRINHWTELIREVWKQAMPTLTTSEKLALVFPFISPYHEDGSDRNRTPDQPLPTVDTNPRFGLVTPFVTMQNRTDVPYGVDEPLKTIVAGGKHHGLVLPFLFTYNGQPVFDLPDEALSSITTHQKHGLVTPFVFSPKLNTVYSGVDEPLSTITTTTGQHNLIPNAAPVAKIEDAYFRMLSNMEIKRAMGFPADYKMKGNAGEQTTLAGHAVTPPAAGILCKLMMETLG
jgi:DNA (cytosine-5)-methyltransferase 1